MTMERPTRFRIYVDCPRRRGPSQHTEGADRVQSQFRPLWVHLGRPRRPSGLDHFGGAQPPKGRPVVDRWFDNEPSVRRFVSSLGDARALRLCYEAGPTGYDLARLLRRLGAHVEVIAPSLIPVAPGAKSKTDARDARRLVHLYRAGELTPVPHPDTGGSGNWGPGPHPGGPDHRPQSLPSPAVQVLAPPQRGLSRGRGLDAGS